MTKLKNEMCVTKIRIVCNDILIEEFEGWPKESDLLPYIPNSLPGKMRLLTPSKEVIDYIVRYRLNTKLSSDNYSAKNKPYDIMIKELKKVVAEGGRSSIQGLALWGTFSKKYKDFLNEMYKEEGIRYAGCSYNRIVPFFNMAKLQEREDKKQLNNFIKLICCCYGISTGLNTKDRKWYKYQRILAQFIEAGMSINKISEELDIDRHTVRRIKNTYFPKKHSA